MRKLTFLEGTLVALGMVMFGCCGFTVLLTGVGMLAPHKERPAVAPAPPPPVATRVKAQAPPTPPPRPAPPIPEMKEYSPELVFSCQPELRGKRFRIRGEATVVRALDAILLVFRDRGAAYISAQQAGLVGLAKYDKQRAIFIVEGELGNWEDIALEAKTGFLLRPAVLLRAEAIP